MYKTVYVVIATSRQETNVVCAFESKNQSILEARSLTKSKNFKQYTFAIKETTLIKKGGIV